MNTSQLRDSLAAAFEITITPETSDIISECCKICVDYNFKPDDLLFEWQALNFNANQGVKGLDRVITPITLDGAKELRNHVARLIAQKNEQRKATRGRGRGRVLNFNAATRVNSNSHASVVAQPTATAPPTRKDRLQTAPCVDFVGPNEKERNKRAYRYMFEKISVRSEALDDRIDELAQLIRETYSIEEFEDPSLITDDPITVVGRICTDSEVDPSSSKLSANTIMLETSRMTGSGRRTPLRFTQDFQIRGAPSGTLKSLFPGEIAAFRGKNGGGGLFLVEEVLPVPILSSRKKEISRPLTVYVTSGPYTSDQALDFTPFTSIINEAKASHPSTLILFGPFIDSAHPHVKSGKLHASPSQLFQEHFLEPIKSLLTQHSDILVVLVPHVRDILCGHAVYPQNATEMDFGPLPSPSIQILPNPCTFSLNGVVFGTSGADILYHLKNQQYIQRSHQSTSNSTLSPPDAMSILCSHVLEQRSFYPVFPVPLELCSDINLDASHLEFLNLAEPGPDILILPSVLRQFSKTVGNSTVINPSMFGKSHIMAQIQIPALTDDTFLKDVVYVELKRIS